jgi:hypothetical protein
LNVSAYTILQSEITPGQEAAARTVLRDYKAFLEDCGAEVTIYRTVYGGANSGRLLLSAGGVDGAARAAFLDNVFARSADNPYQKAIAAANPPLTGWARTMLRSIDPGRPMLAQAPVRSALTFLPAVGRRSEVEQALRDARARHESLGVQADGVVTEVTGPAPEQYAYVVTVGSMAELNDFQRRNAELGLPGPLIVAVESGAMTRTSSRIDIAFALDA